MDNLQNIDHQEMVNLLDIVFTEHETGEKLSASLIKSLKISQEKFFTYFGFHWIKLTSIRKLYDFMDKSEHRWRKRNLLHRDKDIKVFSYKDINSIINMFEYLYEYMKSKRMGYWSANDFNISLYIDDTFEDSPSTFKCVSHCWTFKTFTLYDCCRTNNHSNLLKALNQYNNKFSQVTYSYVT